MPSNNTVQTGGDPNQFARSAVGSYYNGRSGPSSYLRGLGLHLGYVKSDLWPTIVETAGWTVTGLGGASNTGLSTVLTGVE